MSSWKNKEENTGCVLDALSKVTLEFELSRIFPCLTPLTVLVLRGADQAGHKMEADMQSHPHHDQIVSINLIAFIKLLSLLLDILFGNFEEDK